MSAAEGMRTPPAADAAAEGASAPLSHVDGAGAARMVDVGAKPDTSRSARAAGAIRMSAEAFARLRENRLAKGDVLGAERLAGIMAANRTHELIPLCNPLLLTKDRVECELDDALPGVRVTAEVAVSGQTGVEMEALTAVSVACLTLYDMVKAADRAMRIEGIRVLAKSGGRSGDYRAAP